MTFDIIEPRVPAAEGAQSAARFDGSIAVRNVVENEPFGTGQELSFLAEELLPQGSVPEALGFVPIGHEGAWRKDLG